VPPPPIRNPRIGSALRLTFILVVIAMALQGAFLALTILLPLGLHDVPARAALAMRQEWWRMSGFPLLMIGVLVVLPLLALQAPKARGRLRAGSVAYVLAILGQAGMLALLSQEAKIVAPSGPGAWAPGLGAFGAWLLTLSLIVVGRRQTNAARRSAGSPGP
jgi:hypothetical protein